MVNPDQLSTEERMQRLEQKLRCQEKQLLTQSNNLQQIIVGIKRLCATIDEISTNEAFFSN